MSQFSINLYLYRPLHLHVILQLCCFYCVCSWLFYYWVWCAALFGLLLNTEWTANVLVFERFSSFGLIVNYFIHSVFVMSMKISIKRAEHNNNKCENTRIWWKDAHWIATAKWLFFPTLRRIPIVCWSSLGLNSRQTKSQRKKCVWTRNVCCARRHL